MGPGWTLFLEILGAIASLAVVLDYFGIKPTAEAWGSIMALSQKWKLGIMLGLVGLTLWFSGYGFYRSLHPRIVEKIVEKPVDKIVERIVQADCPKVQTRSSKGKSPAKKEKGAATPPSVAQPQQQTLFCEGGNCAQSSGQTGGVTAGVVVDTPPLKITWTVHESVSDKPADFPYAQQVRVSVNTLYTPVSLAIICDSEIGEISVYGALLNFTSGISEKHIAFFKYSSPVLTPEEPLTIQIRAKQPFLVKDVQRAKIN